MGQPHPLPVLCGGGRRGDPRPPGMARPPAGMAHEGPVRRLAQGRGADQGDERRVLDPALRDSRRASPGAQLHPLRGDQAAARVVADGAAHRVRRRGVLYGIYEELRHVFLRIDVDAVTSLGRCGDG